MQWSCQTCANVPDWVHIVVSGSEPLVFIGETGKYYILRSHCSHSFFGFFFIVKYYDDFVLPPCVPEVVECQGLIREVRPYRTSRLQSWPGVKVRRGSSGLPRVLRIILDVANSLRMSVLHVNPERSFRGTNGDRPSEASQFRKGVRGWSPEFFRKPILQMVQSQLFPSYKMCEFN